MEGVRVVKVRVGMGLAVGEGGYKVYPPLPPLNEDAAHVPAEG